MPASGQRFGPATARLPWSGIAGSPRFLGNQETTLFLEKLDVRRSEPPLGIAPNEGNRSAIERTTVRSAGWVPREKRRAIRPNRTPGQFPPESEPLRSARDSRGPLGAGAER